MTEPSPSLPADRWTPERVQLLRALWADKTMSADRIGKVLGGGLSKNAVIGRAYRMGLPPRAKMGQAGRPTGGRAIVIAARARTAASPQPRPAVVRVAPLPIRPQHWPIEPEDDPDTFLPVIADAPPDPSAPGVPWPGKTGVECKDIIGDISGPSETWRVCGKPVTARRPSCCAYHAAVYYPGERR